MSVGHALGDAGGSLRAGGFGADARATAAGNAGEKRTAAVLNGVAHGLGGPTVLHDLRIPIPGIRANIDHVVVSGRTIAIIDSKTWKPALYWTLGGRTRRGFEAFEAADKRTVPMARDGLASLLAKAGVRASFARPLIVVWPSSGARPLNLTFYRPAGARGLAGPLLDAFARARFTEPADPHIVNALRPLLLNSRG